MIERMKKKVKEIVDDEEKKDGPRISTPPRPVSVGGVVTSPGIGFLKVQEEVDNIDKIHTRGNIREKLLGQGIKFDTASKYILANDKNFEEETREHMQM